LPSYGLIVEGAADIAVYRKLIPRADTLGSKVYPLECSGRANLMKLFPQLLNTFKHIHNGAAVDRALVIRDCDGREPAAVLAEMEARLEGKRYPFGVRLCVVRRNMDAWLLADHAAISAVAGGRQVTPVNDNIEELGNPKSRVMAILSEARLQYTPTVLAAIADVLNLDILRNRARLFRDFERAVNEDLVPGA
jgi:hypothetical protein